MKEEGFQGKQSMQSHFGCVFLQLKVLVVPSSAFNPQYFVWEP